MEGFHTRTGVGALLLAVLAGALLAGPAIAAPRPDPDPAARPGSYCPPGGGCRAAPASGWSTGAFAAAIAAVAVGARRRTK